MSCDLSGLGVRAGRKEGICNKGNAVTTPFPLEHAQEATSELFKARVFPPLEVGEVVTLTFSRREKEQDRVNHG